MPKQDEDDLRFIVERPIGQRDHGSLEDIGAPGGYLIEPSGALVFYGDHNNVLIAYAPHAWLTVVPG